jgi:crotonobetainyl-CoA:carnitine CoA-transferase CaiB-like acyl-CoA transferase
VRALHRFYACGDGGWLALVCEGPAEALAVGRVLGVDIGDAAEALTAPRDGALSEALAATFSQRPRAELLEALLAAGIAAAPALRGPEAFDSEWLRQNDLFETWVHPRIGEMVSVRAYADFSRGPGGFRYPTPDLGEHSGELLRELGIAPERIEALFATGAVFEPAEHHTGLAKSARPGDGGVALMTQ